MLRVIEEIRFWTGIMRDHAEFILTSLSYNEEEEINHAEFFKLSFARLHEQSKQVSEGHVVNTEILNRCINLLINFINFKRQLLGKLLKCQLNTSLPPTFYNHMINEAMEFYKILIRTQSHAKVNALLEILNLHQIWLPDAAGHAASIAGDLDPTEKLLIKEAQQFEKIFNSLALKAEELGKMLVRTGLNDGALSFLNQEAKKNIEEFIAYLEKIKELTMGCKVLGTLKPLIPDHMIREENYYLHKVMSFE